MRSRELRSLILACFACVTASHQQTSASRMWFLSYFAISIPYPCHTSHHISLSQHTTARATRQKRKWKCQYDKTRRERNEKLEAHRNLLSCVLKLLLLFLFLRYTWNGKNSQYPMIKTIHYPRYNTPNPIVTCFVVKLSVTSKFSVMPLILPSHLNADEEEFYITNMFWISGTELTLTFTARSQLMASTLLCMAPDFQCVEVIRNVLNLTVKW